MAKEVIKVDLGCGNRKAPGFIGIDRYKIPGVDIVADLNKGIPLEDNSVDLILANHSLEHLDNLVFIMKEIYRVCRHGAIICVVAPYHLTSLNLANPYHKQVFNDHTFRFFTKEASSLIDSKEYYCPHAIQWGLLNSDNSDIDIDIRTLKIKHYYYSEYENYPEEELRRLRNSNINVCHQIMYHLLVVKQDIPNDYVNNLSKSNLFKPDNISAFEKEYAYIESVSVGKSYKEKFEEEKEKNKNLKFDIKFKEELLLKMEETIADMSILLTNKEKELTKLEELLSSKEKLLSKIKEKVNEKSNLLAQKTEEMLEKGKIISDYEDSLVSLRLNEQYYINRAIAWSNEIKPLLTKYDNYRKIRIVNNKKSSLLYDIADRNFIDKVILSINDDMSNYFLVFSDIIPCESYVEYKVSIPCLNCKINLYIVTFFFSNLFIEFVQNNKIIQQNNIDVSKDGKLTVDVSKLSGEMEIRLKTNSSYDIIRVLVWRFSGIYIFNRNKNDKLVYTTNYVLEEAEDSSVG